MGSGPKQDRSKDDQQARQKASDPGAAWKWMLPRKAAIKSILDQKPHGVHRRDLIQWASNMRGFEDRKLASAARAVRVTLARMETEGLLLEDVTGRVYLRGQEAS